MAKPEEPKKRKAIDWEAIEREYRAGQLSIREIARQHHITDGAIRKRAKRDGWKRNLAKKVREAVRERMVRREVRTQDASDEEIINHVAERAADVLVLHREDIASLRELETALIEELKDNPTKLYLAQYKGKIIKKTVGLTASERAMAANNLANVQHKRIQLERQAYSIDGNPEEEDMDEIPITYVPAPERKDDE